jgi:hypothetical protein
MKPLFFFWKTSMRLDDTAGCHAVVQCISLMK